MIERPDTSLATALYPSPNFGPRPTGCGIGILLLHYTGVATCERAIDWLARPESKVSCHYVVDGAGNVTQMVAESMRAWHAGVSSWGGVTDINSTSIGIEIYNPGHELGYPEFPEAQMRSVEALALDIVRRHGIWRESVLAHSDIAPTRKIDPGEKFDWSRLARSGVGHWVPPVEIEDAKLAHDIDATSEAVACTQRLLRRYGYGIDATGRHDLASMKVVAAFQRHFRPQRVDGRIDSSTTATLESLIAALPSRSNRAQSETA